MTKLRNLLLAAVGVGATVAGLLLGALGLARLTFEDVLQGVAVLGALIIAVGIGMALYAAVVRRRERDGRADW